MKFFKNLVNIINWFFFLFVVKCVYKFFVLMNVYFYFFFDSESIIFIYIFLLKVINNLNVLLFFESSLIISYYLLLVICFLSFSLFSLNLLIYYLLHWLLHILGLLMSVAFFTLLERKVMAAMQRRSGPSITHLYTGFWVINVLLKFGLLQPVADGLKLLLKEVILPRAAFSEKIYFFLAPALTFLIALLNWILIPYTSEYFFFYPLNFDIEYSLVFLFGVSSLGAYSVILASWASNSKYPLLGCLRAFAQFLSYEISFGFMILILGLISGSLNIYDIVLAQEEVFFIFPLLPLAYIFLVLMLMETNRAPFDLPEAEAELVSGYNTEYSGMIFAFFFLGEYANMFLMSMLFTLFFLGGWLPIFSCLSFLPEIFWLVLKVLVVSIFFIWTRATFPRYRFDNMLKLGWYVFLPFIFSYFLFLVSVFYYFDCFSWVFFLI